MIGTSGLWIVNHGHEEEFARPWQEGVDSAAMDYPEVRFRLLRDHQNARRFVSFGEGWRTVEQVETMRETPEFGEFLASLRPFLDSEEMSTLELVAEVS